MAHVSERMEHVPWDVLGIILATNVKIVSTQKGLAKFMIPIVSELTNYCEC